MSRESFRHPFHDEDTASPFTTIDRPVVVTDYQICCQLTAAFEGGSNYWIARVDTIGDRAKGREFLQDEPLLGGALNVVLESPDDMPGGTLILNRAGIAAGLALMAKLAPRHFNDVVTDGGDAITGDVFLQCCVLGEVMYGG